MLVMLVDLLIRENVGNARENALQARQRNLLSDVGRCLTKFGFRQDAVGAVEGGSSQVDAKGNTLLSEG